MVTIVRSSFSPFLGCLIALRLDQCVLQAVDRAILYITYDFFFKICFQTYSQQLKLSLPYRLNNSKIFLYYPDIQSLSHLESSRIYSILYLDSCGLSLSSGQLNCFSSTLSTVKDASTWSRSWFCYSLSKKAATCYSLMALQSSIKVPAALRAWPRFFPLISCLVFAANFDRQGALLSEICFLLLQGDVFKMGTDKICCPVNDTSLSNKATRKRARGKVKMHPLLMVLLNFMALVPASLFCSRFSQQPCGQSSATIITPTNEMFM